MQKRQSPLPRLWLMTDERMGDALLPSIEGLPKGSGIVFRHYSLNEKDRRELFAQVRAVAKRRRHIVLFAGPPKVARSLNADGAHGRKRGALSAPVHSLRELVAAERLGMQIIFASPVFETASHIGLNGLGRVHFGMIVRKSRLPVVALGGMTETRARSLRPFKIHGWAAIDALSVRISDRRHK